MNTLQKQKIDKQQFSIFLRDLASNLNINLKHMIEDSVKKEDQIKKKKNYHKQKKKVVKKKDLIIQEQNEKRRKLNIEDDFQKMDFLFQNFAPKNPFDQLIRLKTPEGKKEFQFKLLSYFWEHKKGNMKYIFLLYFTLKDNQHELIDKIEALLEDYDYQLYMMKEAGDMLPPLNYWDKQVYSFEDWQLKVIHHVKDNQSVIVKAPTSSGKSFIAMSAGIFHKKILYICPAKPVAYQVGSHFNHMGFKVHFLVNNQSHYSYDSKTNIFIGTPYEIENNLIQIGTDFDYVVFDEIHNLNKEEDGDIYENLIKLIPCNFLALSATIKNIDFLKDIFHKIHPKKKINYVEYNQRFINHQRWVWKGDQFKKLHPLCAFQTIEDGFFESPISYTPNDCACLWEKIDEIFEDINDENDVLDNCSPDEYFDTKLITLNDCKEYERFLKDKLKELNTQYPQEVQQVFDSFQENPVNDKGSIINLIKGAKKKDMFPMIMFHTNEEVCKNLFHSIYEQLNEGEETEYPFHYEILEKKEELFQEYLKKREVHKSNIKVQTTNPTYEIKEKMEQYDKREKFSFIKNMTDFYQQKLNFIEKEEEKEESIKELQIKNLTNEMNSFLLNPEFNSQDIFQKHRDFIFTKSNKPMDANTIREVRREIKKTLGIKIPYESPIFQMLKRGIGLYIETMPDEYNWILQKLLSEKEIGIVISDKTLCLGIDLPVRTSCFLGINDQPFTKEEYLQMSGRAGRRGMDTKGNILFYGSIDYLSLMKGDLPKIIGSQKSIYENYKVLLKHEPIFKNMIHKDRSIISVPEYQKVDGKDIKLIWNIRKYRNSFLFLKKLQNIEKELYVQHENDRERYILNLLSELIGYSIYDSYKLKKIEKYSDVKKMDEYLDTIITIHNSLNYQKYRILKDTFQELFIHLNRIVFNTIL